MAETALRDLSVPDNDQADVDLENAIAQLGDEECMVYVHTVEKNGEKTYEGKMQPGEFSWEEVRSRYGGGKKYWVQVIARNERGQIEWTKHGTQQVGKSADEKAAERPQHLAPVGGFDAREFAREVADAMRPMQERMDRLDRLVERMLDKPQQSIDPVAMVGTMVGAMAQLQTLVPKPPVGAGGAVFSDFRQLLELASDLAANREDADPIQLLVGAIEKVGPQLLETAKTASAQAAALPTATEPAPAQPAAGEAPRETPPAQESTMLDLLDDDTKLTMAILLDAAQKNKDPANYIGMVIDDVVPKIPAPMLPSLLEAPAENLARLDRRWKNYQPWVDKLIGYVQQELAEIEREQAEAEKGNATKAGTDEGTSG